MTEHAVAQSQAQCFVYDAASSSWKPLAEGVVNLYLYHHPANRSYRVIGMNGQQQVVINSSLFPECKYSHSNNVFHTWTDIQFAYGIHFASEDLAKKFSADFAACLVALNKADGGPPPPPTAGAASAASAGGGGAAPPPPPPDSPGPAPAPGGGGAGMSLAEQIAAKKLKKAEERPPEEEKPAPASGGGGGGGNLMGELANALTRRSGTGTLKTAIKPKAPAAPAPESPREAAPPKPAPAEPPAVAALQRGDSTGTPVGTPGAVRKKMPGGGAGAPGAPAAGAKAAGAPSAAAAVTAGAAAVGAAGGLSKADIDKLRDELVKSFREELAAFKTGLLADIAALLAEKGGQEAPPPPPPGDYYEEEEGY